MSQPFFLSVRAIEDIIGIQKPGETPRLTSLNEIEEVVYSVNRFDSSYSFSEESSLQEFKTAESINSDHSKISPRLEKSGSEGDYSIRNSLESIKFTGEINSEADLRSWPSDSDITILRMKKEFRNELSSKMDWEEERRLTDNSSHNLEWESHSLVNLADVLKEKDQTEGLTPFTIWAKGNQGAETVAEPPPNAHSKDVELTEKILTEDESVTQNSQETDFLKANVDSIDETENKNTETTKTDSENNQIREDNVSTPSKSKLIRGFFRSLFRCGSKRQESVDEIGAS